METAKFGGKKSSISQKKKIFTLVLIWGFSEKELMHKRGDGNTCWINFDVANIYLT